MLQRLLIIPAIKCLCAHAVLQLTVFIPHCIGWMGRGKRVVIDDVLGGLELALDQVAFSKPSARISLLGSRVYALCSNASCWSIFAGTGVNIRQIIERIHVAGP